MKIGERVSSIFYRLIIGFISSWRIYPLRSTLGGFKIPGGRLSQRSSPGNHESGGAFKRGLDRIEYELRANVHGDGQGRSAKA